MPDKVKVLVPDVENIHLQTPVFINITLLLDKTTEPKIKQQQILLSGYLRYHETIYESKITEFLQGQEYPLIIYDEKNSVKKIGMILSLSLTYRMKDSLIWPCYNVLDKNEGACAKGAFADIFKIGTLSYNIYQLLYYNNKKNRIAKIFNHIIERPILISFNLKNDQDKKKLRILPSDTKMEAKLCKAATHLHSKNIVFKEDREKNALSSWIVMRECPGLPLYLITYNDLTQKNKLTTYQRYWLSYTLARAMKWKVHKKKIIHRDVKPGNIMVHITDATCEVNFIDFGLAIHEDDLDERCCGTPNYTAPEVIFKKHRMGYLTDSYSLGIAMTEIWGAYPIQNFKEFYNSYYFPHLFAGVEDCTEEEKQMIYQLLLEYTSLNTKNRIKNSIGVKRWDVLFFKYRTRHLTPESCKPFIDAHRLGIRILSKLDRLGLNLITDPINDLVTIKNVFVNILNQTDYDPKIFEQPLVVTEFTQTLAIQALKPVTHLQDIFIIIDNTRNTLIKMNAVLLAILQKVKLNLRLIEFVNVKQDYEQNKNYLENLLLLVQSVIAKPKRREITLDNFISLTISLSKKIEQLNQHLNEFDQLFDKHSAFSTVKTYKDLYSRLNLKSDDHDGLSKLKNRVMQAIIQYLDLTLTHENITKDLPDRAASERRREDINRILNNVDQKTSFKALKQALQSDMKMIRTGFFGRSKLNSLVTTAIESTDKEIKHYAIPS